MTRWGLLGAALVAAGSVARGGNTAAVWRRVPRLPAAREERPLVTVVVPARNEEANLDACLRSLRAQRHQELRIVVVDDASTDWTGEIARRHADVDSRVHVLASDGPPEGWAGKVHAMHLGVEQADGEWLLFLDADVVVAPDLVGRLLAGAEEHDADLISTAGRAARPSMAWWFLLLRKSMSAGVGERVSNPAGAFLVLASAGSAHIAYGLAPIAAVASGVRGRSKALVLLGALGWLGQALAHWAYVRRVSQPASTALIAPVATAGFGVLMVNTGWRALRGGTTWKGRNVSG